jgi:hypothetical protein
LLASESIFFCSGTSSTCSAFAASTPSFSAKTTVRFNLRFCLASLPCVIGLAFLSCVFCRAFLSCVFGVSYSRALFASVFGVRYVARGSIFTHSGERLFDRRLFSFKLEPILRLFNSKLRSRLERVFVEKNIFIVKTRHAISCAVNFYNAGAVTRQS